MIHEREDGLTVRILYDKEWIVALIDGERWLESYPYSSKQIAINAFERLKDVKVSQ